MAQEITDFNHSFLKHWIEQIELKVRPYRNTKEELLYGFVEDIYHNAVTFYLNWETAAVSFQLLEFLPKKSIKLSEQEKYLDKILLDEIKQSNRVSAINRLLIIDSWSTFEINMYNLAREYFNHQTLRHLRKNYAFEMFSLLKNTEITYRDCKKIVKKKIVDDVSKLSVLFVASQLFKLCKNYPGDIKSDSKFLGNFNQFRNMLHTGFLNFGKELKFRESTFTFYVPEKGSMMLLNENQKEIHDIRGYTVLIDRLIKIWLNMVSSIEIQAPKGLAPVVTIDSPS